MVFAHVLQDENDNVVTNVVDGVMETKFLMSTETYRKILEIAEQFEDSIKWALQSDEFSEDMCKERSTVGKKDGEPSESDHEAQETAVYQVCRIWRHCYQLTMSCLSQ